MVDAQSFGSMAIPRSKTIWGLPPSNVPALRLGSIELCNLDKANFVLDEWDFARTRDKQSGTSKRHPHGEDDEDADEGGDERSTLKRV
jgi:hypothetical protein